ncbi:DNA mismatch repair endonuclease MutL [Rubrobacter tropicus]|uniref:DNA mismatch repair protein MutL n=1 Tax=Rubrobacter tropicus TaxID=2653851 RepID=A0A6G8Q4H4_9ACTN|nr:DNA mismatch repair endonuclease MutL [Rubrobacter tropicus]QIN81350.1 DNA mismatch repair endonuclease MutL [Rubrobacter tropicus]
MRLFPKIVAEETAEYGGRVRVLAPEVAHRIAAGEVIERPASAVKELVENSLDAGATRVEVDVEDGGISLIRVTDDGHGMSADDAERAVAEHATSKIRTADDLARVESLGFRGEALHAIGSVSHLALTTNARGTAGPGFRVGVRAGETVEAGPASHPPGTTVEARELFLNLPVRRGFLGTVRAEANAVATVVQALALGRPDVGFFLRSDGRGVLALPAAADLRERVAQVHGLSLARGLVTLEDPVVWGLVSPLEVSFPTRRHLHVCVNGRVVDTDSFAPAIARAYADLLPKGRHPAAFLRLDLGPGEVDVNVHPAKSAVRLRGGRSAYPLVVGTIRAALSPERGPGIGVPVDEGDNDLVPIGQFAGRCIVAREGEDLVILDQHGAHERILYERLRENPRAAPVSLENPAVAMLPEDLAPEAWAFEAELGSLGFLFEPFGADAVRLTAAPGTAVDPEAAFLAAVHALAGGEDLAKALACKGSTKFGESLSKEEMAALLQAWSKCRFRDVCPHGRPIVKRVALADLLREFGRL